MSTKGHHAAYSGLRGHSTGKHYPWSIVGIGGHPGTRWACWNLITGKPLRTLAHIWDGKTDPLDCTFRSYAAAERFLDKLLEKDS
jgi:hypothetical protein